MELEWGERLDALSDAAQRQGLISRRPWLLFYAMVQEPTPRARTSTRAPALRSHAATSHARHAPCAIPAPCATRLAPRRFPRCAGPLSCLFPPAVEAEGTTAPTTLAPGSSASARATAS